MASLSIVLSGMAGTGKDSVAKLLVEHYGFSMFSLSSTMKKFCKEVFDFDDEQLYGRSRSRNAPDERWARTCECQKSAARDNVNCLLCEGKGKINDNSPRRILQLLGTEWARDNIHPDIWTISSRKKLKSMVDLGIPVVVNDARFKNDRDNLREWFGAFRVVVMAPNKKRKVENESWRKHRSETSIPKDDEVEYVINNDEQWPFPDLHRKVNDMLVSLYGGKYFLSLPNIINKR
jgi:hypothetical protein